MPVIDDSDATPLPPSFLAPADFSNSTCSTDHISLIRSQTERQLQGSVFFIREQLPDPPREWRRLKKLAYCIRHWLSPSIRGFYGFGVQFTCQTSRPDCDLKRANPDARCPCRDGDCRPGPIC